MFHTEDRLNEKRIKIAGFQPFAIYPLASEGLLKMAIGLKWPKDYVVKRGYLEQSAGDYSYTLTSRFSFRFSGIVNLALPTQELNANLARIFAQHPNKVFYTRGAYFVPAMAGDREAEYDFYYLDFFLFTDAKTSRYYVVEKKLDIEQGRFGELFSIAGTYKHKHSVIGPMTYFPRRKSHPAIIKTSHPTSDSSEQRFFIMFQNEVNGMRALNDVKVKSSVMFAREQLGSVDYKLAKLQHEDYHKEMSHGLNSVLVMPFIYGFTLEELYEVRTPKANGRRHAEALELNELVTRELARKQGNNHTQETIKQDEMLRMKIEARAFLRSDEGRLIVFKQCLQRLMTLHAKEILHGDLKDSNIMVEINIHTKAVTVKYLDFGFSCSPSNAVSFLPFQHRVVGSVQQMAPELLVFLLDKEAAAQLSYLTDEYALGIVLLGVLGDTSVSNFSQGPLAYAKMRCQEERVQHELFYQLNYHQNVKDKITAMFNQWLQLKPENRLRLPAIQSMFDEIAEEHHKLKKPDQSAAIAANHQAAIRSCRENKEQIDAATHLLHALALCKQLKTVINELQDHPAAIRMYAHTVNIAAFMHLETKAALVEMVDLYYAAYETSYQACQKKLDELKQLEDAMQTESVEKRNEYRLYLDHASLFMRTREQKRCQLDELAVEAEHMQRKSEKFTSCIENYLCPK